MAKTRTTESYNIEIERFGIRCVDFKGMNKLCRHSCLTCSVLFDKRPANVLYHGTTDCPNCKSKQQNKAINVYNQALRRHDLPFVAIRFDGKKVVHKCLNAACGKEFSRSRGNMLSGKSKKCPECSGTRTVHTVQSYERVVRPRGIELRTDVLTRQKEKHPHGCLKCGNEWWATLDNVLRGHGCPTCGIDQANNAFERKRVRVGRRIFALQGYEPQALEYLQSVGCNLKKLACSVQDGKPTFRYRFGGKTCLYVPDFYHTSLKRVIEVKSTWTFLHKDFFNRNKAKAKQVLKSHDFTMLVLDRHGARIKLPADWYNMTRKQVSKLIGWKYA